ncbi:hypothetical protein BSF41_18660 [Flavobacterium sp. ACN2]|uniref:hypothetical protein n=1 Tax=Flavobacterium sp. ACN2 TaxID=1975676 RepID=UPI000BB3D0C0|nr:hypothetical protein [Flavobacterium sp. ACN2]PBI90195.1 hypothetical protein BSF41_18660 [Flavobacterium sp. ACN2]
MENSKLDNGKSYCRISNTLIYSDDNKDLVCVKMYKGDWGDWDEKPEITQSISKDCEDNIIKNPSQI